VKTKSQYPERFSQPDFIAKLQAGDEGVYREFDDEFFRDLPPSQKRNLA
jgi:hypothetical protein